MGASLLKSLRRSLAVLRRPFGCGPRPDSKQRTSIVSLQAPQVNETDTVAVPADGPSILDQVSIDEVIGQINELGGRVAIDEETPGSPVVLVEFWGDAKLELVTNLPQLQTLNLSGTNVGDVGLEHIKGMTKLQTLRLANTKLTDAGLEHLETLKQLRELGLYSTDVTEAGVVELRKTLRKVSIE